MARRLEGKRALITQASEYMGPAISELFAAEGADVLSSDEDLAVMESAARVVSIAEPLDILIANLAHPPEPQAAPEIGDQQWHRLFDRLVHPLMRLVRAALPAMLERKRGKIVAVTSAAPLRGIPNTAAYCAARGAQNAFIRAVGIEVARANVQVNAIAQNYVENDTYFPKDLLNSERFKKHLVRNVPAQRVASGRESAELALFLASEHSDFIVGQIVPFAGGWTTTTG